MTSVIEEGAKWKGEKMKMRVKKLVLLLLTAVMVTGAISPAAGADGAVVSAASKSSPISKTKARSIALAEAGVNS